MYDPHRPLVFGGNLDPTPDGPAWPPRLARVWVEQVTRFAAELGMDTFVFWPEADRLSRIELFAAEVVPAVRAAVARARGSAY